MTDDTSDKRKIPPVGHGASTAPEVPLSPRHCHPARTENPYIEYERGKQRLYDLSLDPESYEKELVKLAKRLCL